MAKVHQKALLAIAVISGESRGLHIPLCQCQQICSREQSLCREFIEEHKVGGIRELDMERM